MARRSVGDTVRVADGKRIRYTTALGREGEFGFAPLKLDIAAVFGKGVGTAAVLSGDDVLITYQPGTTTLGALRAALLVEPGVVGALLLATGSDHDADILPDIGEPTLELWRDVPAPPVLACGLDGAGRLKPLTAGPENASDDIEIELDTARVAPGEELVDKLGDSLSGTSLTVARLTGEVRLKFDKTHDDLTGLAAAQYGTLAFDLATKKITRTTGDWNTRTGGDVLNYSAKGTKITIVGSVGNDGTYTVVGLGANAKELVVEEALVNEGASATETVSGYRPVTGVLLSALAWPASVEFSGSFSKVYAEHSAQAGCDLVLHVGRTQ